MSALEFLARFSEMAGQGAPVVLFSALRLSEAFGISSWNARNLLQELRAMNLIKRIGNQYHFNRHGMEVQKAMERAYVEVYEIE